MAAPLDPQLYWREGMFLRPHHFQHLQRQLAQREAFLLDSQLPHRWGILRLRHDEKLLPTGTYRLAECTAVLRDGIVIAEGLIARPLEIDLRPHQAELRGKKQGIYLAVPRTGRAEVADPTASVPPDPSQPRRYLPVAREALDSNTGDNPQPIDCILADARLLLETEDRAACECLKLAEVTYQEDSFQLDPEYVPPTALVQPGTPVHELCSRVLSDLQEGARYAIGLFSQQAPGQRDAMSLEIRLKVHGLLSSAPLLQGILESGAARPLDLYLALCRALGDLVGLQAEADLIPEAIPRYDHEDLAGTFQALRNRIEDVLRPIIRRRYPDYPFRLAAEQEFHLDQFQMGWVQRPLYLAVQATRSTEETRRWMDNCLIGGPAALGDFRRKLILGLDRTLVEDPPPEIGLKRDWLIYRLGIDPKLHGPIIDGIQQEGRLAVKAGWQGGAGAVPPQKMTLIVKAEEEGPAKAGK